jgi:hypothetical protein
MLLLLLLLFSKFPTCATAATAAVTGSAAAAAHQYPFSQSLHDPVAGSPYWPMAQAATAHTATQQHDADARMPSTGHLHGFQEPSFLLKTH